MSEEIEKPKHSLKGRSCVSVPIKRGSEVMTYQELPDEAADFLLQMAANADARVVEISSLKQRLTNINLIFVGAILSYNLQIEQTKEQIATLVVSISLLLILSVVSGVLHSAHDTARTYHRTVSRQSTGLCQRHFRLRSIHWDADADYELARGRLTTWLRNRHLDGTTLLNILVPVIGAGLLQLNFCLA